MSWTMRLVSSLKIMLPFFRSSRIHFVRDPTFNFSTLSWISFTCSLSFRIASCCIPSVRRSTPTSGFTTATSLSRTCCQVMVETLWDCCGLLLRLPTSLKCYLWRSSRFWESFEYCSISFFTDHLQMQLPAQDCVRLLRRITQVFCQVFSKSFYQCQVNSRLVTILTSQVFFKNFMNLVDRDLTEHQITQTLTLSRLVAQLGQTRGIRPVHSHATS